MRKISSIVLVFVLCFNLGAISFAAKTDLGTNETIINSNLSTLKTKIKEKNLVNDNGDYLYGHYSKKDKSKWTFSIIYDELENNLSFAYIYEDYSNNAMINTITMAYNRIDVATKLEYLALYRLDPYTVSSKAESAPFYAKDFIQKSDIDIASISSSGGSSFVDAEKVLFSSHALIAFSHWEDLVRELCGFGLAGIGFTRLCQNHVFSETSIATATCEQEGKVRYTCNNCTYSYEETTAPTGHSRINSKGICDKCGQKVIDVSKCSCTCHKTDFFSKLVTSFKMIFWKLFRIKQTCDCGIYHY